MTPQPGSPVDFCFPSGKSSYLLGEVGASKVGLLSCGSWHFGASSEGAGSLQWAFRGVLSYCSCLERGTAFVGAGVKGRPFEREEPIQIRKLLLVHDQRNSAVGVFHQSPFADSIL